MTEGQRGAEGPEGSDDRRGAPLVAALLAGAGALQLAIEAALPGSREVGAGYPPYLLLGAAVEGAAATALWFRKRWGIMAYASFFPFHQLALLIAGTWGPASFALRVGALAAMIRAHRVVR